MSQTKPGRSRIKLAELLDKMLEEKGIIALPIDPSAIWLQPPVYRGPTWDLAVWGVNKVRVMNGPDLEISSWDTMADCCRLGIECSEYATHHLDVSRKEAPVKRPANV